MMDKITAIIKNALKEDMPRGDISTDTLFTDERSRARIVAKEDGVLSGMAICQKTFLMVDPETGFDMIRGDAEQVEKGSVLAYVEGKTSSILKAERVALNFLQRLSGIATFTNQFVKEIAGTSAKIYDTRKTTPNLRILEKQAVLDGGGMNHRMNLSEMVMLKDNHIQAAGSITKAVTSVRDKLGDKYKIEVEVESVPMFQEALSTSCDIIMLDNMSLVDMAECVRINNGQKKLEASGNMSLERVRKVAETGVDMISVGMLTHSYKSMDISLKF